MKNNQVIKGNNNQVVDTSKIVNQVAEADRGPVVFLKNRKEVQVFGRPFKLSWLLVSGGIGFTTDFLALVFSFEPIVDNLFVWNLVTGLLMVFAMAVGLYVYFQSGGMVRFGKRNIMEREGILKEEHYDVSPCPKCGGKLFFDVEKEKGDVLKCVIYPNDHCFPFSTRIFDHASYPQASDVAV